METGQRWRACCPYVCSCNCSYLECLQYIQSRDRRKLGAGDLAGLSCGVREGQCAGAMQLHHGFKRLSVSF